MPAMTEKFAIDWSLDQQDVVLTLTVRIPSDRFLDIARQAYHALKTIGRTPAERLIPEDPGVETRQSD